MGKASVVFISATLGISKPLLGFFTSSMALLSGAEPSLLIPTRWAKPFDGLRIAKNKNAVTERRKNCFIVINLCVKCKV